MLTSGNQRFLAAMESNGADVMQHFSESILGIYVMSQMPFACLSS